VHSVVWNRRLIEVEATHSSRGPWIGLAPRNCEVGDLICILFGCSVPVVLKETKALYMTANSVCKIVGEAYIYGMMDGEAVRDTELVQTVTRDFILS
jgi:hypothetical protein